ncbi:potassium-tellurite ethidium and proflavin transporter [Sinorhizobium medicae]|nr:potassium-tellurite ethidium and proflavin transporter [Sinorhizobium medicae]MDX0425046.1 potassium-tellurite ethidium and proflavin transporter [Sinorhizobium medicae]MDX0498491.1 potassium-tellurite ethidium and proflavin transporter [Sinorhizobium medicae]MDX0509694.1 potassium-tellurite ethidium and proflavin transporter [Sinorhizobium medicae]MDX0528718.1 potassium-tellurite ethidium and proflavin transporter [Sinorhizobium medicae]
MLGYALLQAAILARLIPWIAKHGFSVSYWSFTFGATALASATPRAAGKTEDPAITSLAIGLFVLTNLTMLAILAGTAVLTGSGSLLPATVPKPEDK